MANSSVKLKQVNIKDDIKSFGPTTTMTYAVENSSSQTGTGTDQIANLWIAGQTPDLSGLRPTGARAQVMIAGYNSTLENSIQLPIAEGNLEYVDDFTDASRAEYKIELSQLQTSYPQDQKVSFIVNALDTSYQAGWTNISVLAKACSIVGMTLGECALPSVAIIGTFDVVSKSPVEVAQEFISAFNVLDSNPYYVRITYNQLDIIQVNFDLGDTTSPSGPAYDIGQKAISIERHFSMYIPKIRIGQGQNIFLQGATDIVPVPPAQPNPTTPAPAPVGPQTITFTQTFQANSKTDIPIGDSGNFDKWTIKTRVMQISVTVNNGTWDSDPGPDTTIWNLPNITPNPNPQIKGAYLSPTVSITDSCILSEETQEYDSINGLTKDTVTQYGYDYETFSSTSNYNQVLNKRVLLHDQTVTTAYAGGQKIPISMVDRYYNYGGSGGLLVTITYTHLYSPPSQDQSGGWKLTDITSEWADNFDLVLPNLSIPGEGTLAGWQDLWDGQVTTQTIDLTVGAPKGTVEKYQTLNGERIYLWLENIDEQVYQTGKLPDVSVVDTLTMAFTMSIPYSGYDGLAILYGLLVLAQQQASNTSYWEDITVTIPYDMSPCVGIEHTAGNVTGICVGYEHNITSDEAITRVMLRTLVTS